MPRGLSQCPSGKGRSRSSCWHPYPRSIPPCYSSSMASDMDHKGVRKKDALDYHANPKPGKIEVVPTKPFSNQRDLSLAYTPGVAEPCLAIAENPDLAYTYTTKGNLVA